MAKLPYGPAAQQEEINRILVERARAGLFVVRLKGGDPYVFGRGGEEVLACAEAGVPVTVVPGVTSAIAVPAAAGIPVTHRRVAHEFTVVSGHIAPGPPGLAGRLARAGQAARHPGDPDGPEEPARHRGDAAGPRPRRRDPGRDRAGRHHRPSACPSDGTLADLPDLAKAYNPPAIVVIGDVAAILPLPFSERT